MAVEPPEPVMSRLRILLRWCAGGLLAGVVGCGNPDVPTNQHDSAAATEHGTAATAESSTASEPAYLLPRQDGLLRMQSDDIAYAPLAMQPLNDGDVDAWRQALPAGFVRRDMLDEGASSCGEDIRERMVHFEDADARNVIELRACASEGAETFLAWFSFQDGIVDFTHGLDIGDSLSDVLAKLGSGEQSPLDQEVDGVQALEIVNAEDNTTLRLHFDGDGRVRQIEFEPYTG